MGSFPTSQKTLSLRELVTTEEGFLLCAYLFNLRCCPSFLSAAKIAGGGLANTVVHRVACIGALALGDLSFPN